MGGLLAVFLAGLLTGNAASAWLLVLGFQLMGVIAGLAGLRTCGFRLGHVADDAADTPSGETSKQLQFSLRHLLVWSTAAAVVFVLANAIQLGNMRYLDVADVAQAVSIAACLSVVAVTAIWAALSREKVFLRLAVLIVLIGAAGALLWWVNVSRTQALFARGVSPNATYLRWEMHRLGYWWFAWSLLSGLFLAELLLFFRVRGYRLARRVRGS